MTIEQPGVAGASGYSFNPQTRQASLPTPTDPWAQVKAADSFFDKFVEKKKKPNDIAFMEGVTDQIAGRVKESSWLTPDSYNQGVQFQQYTDKESQAQAGLTQTAREILEKGGTLDDYHEAIKPMLQELRDNIDVFPENSEARKKALQSYVTLNASAFSSYQKSWETKIQQDNNTAQYQGINTDINKARELDYQPEAFTKLMVDRLDTLTTQNKMLGSKDPLGDSSKKMVQAMRAQLATANPATPEGQRVLAAIGNFARSDEAQKRLATDDYLNLQEAMAKGQKGAMDHRAMVLNANFIEYERGVESGSITPDPATITGFYQQAILDNRNGLLKDEDVVPMLRRIREMESKINSQGLDGSFAQNSTPAARAAKWGTDGDAKAADSLVKVYAKKFGEDYIGLAKGLVATGIQTINPKVVSAGFKQLTPTIENIMQRDPDKIDEQVDGTSKDAWRGFVDIVQSLKGKNPGMLREALGAFSDKGTQDAVEAYLQSNPEAGKNIAFDMREIQRFKEQVTGTGSGGSHGGSYSSAVGSGKFTADDLKSGFFASHVWPFFGDDPQSQVKADRWWKNPRNDVLQQKASILNQSWDSARPELAAMAAGGAILETPGQKIAALRKLNRVTSIDTGLVIMTPQIRNGVTVPMGAGGKEVALNDQDFQGALEAVRDQYVKKYNGYGGRKFDAEDVQLTAVGNQLMVVATDKSGKPVTEMQRWGISHVREVAYNMLKARTHDLGVQPIGTVTQQDGKSAKKLTVTQDWVDTFGGDLATKTAASFLRYEGSVDNKATDPSRPGIVTTGIGIRVDTPDRATWKKKLDDARAKGQEAFDGVQGQFVKDYFKNFGTDIKNADLPPVASVNATGLASSYIALAHAKWQGGQGGADQYARILKVAQSDPKQAEELFKQSSMYKEITQKFGGKDNHPRLQMYRDGFNKVSQLTRAGSLGGLRAMGPKTWDAFTKPTYSMN
jgi:hypothetical protein